MALKGPKGAHPTLRGWVHPKTGELLKSQKISQAEIDAFHGKVEAPIVEIVIEPVKEVVAPVVQQEEVDFEKMTKAQILKYAAENDIDVDSTKKRFDLIEDLKALNDA
jgi:hypothetical protein